MLRSTKSDLDIEQTDPLLFSKSTAHFVTGTRRRLASRSPIERSARIMGSSTVLDDTNGMTEKEHTESFQDHEFKSEPLNRGNILRHNSDSSSRPSFCSNPGLSEVFVADTDYYRMYYSKDKNVNLMDKRLSADRSGRFCAIFSLVGLLFLVSISLLIIGFMRPSDNVQ